MNTSAVEEGLWTVADVASYLRLSRSWVYQASAAGMLPCVRIGRRSASNPKRCAAGCAARVSGTS
jgi:excisionase family DNA binding protein